MYAGDSLDEPDDYISLCWYVGHGVDPVCIWRERMPDGLGQSQVVKNKTLGQDEEEEAKQDGIRG